MPGVSCKSLLADGGHPCHMGDGRSCARTGGFIWSTHVILTVQKVYTTGEEYPEPRLRLFSDLGCGTFIKIHDVKYFNLLEVSNNAVPAQNTLLR